VLRPIETTLGEIKTAGKPQPELHLFPSRARRNL
jgi:hypothetical protein